MYKAINSPQSNTISLLEEELFKLLDVEINILDHRIYNNNSCDNIANLEDAKKKLSDLRRILLSSNSLIDFNDFQKYSNYIIETIEVSLY
ncbi:MAG: hypothetical protein ACQERB_07715 [Promethearchaeati archaeon]